MSLPYAAIDKSHIISDLNNIEYIRYQLTQIAEGKGFDEDMLQVFSRNLWWVARDLDLLAQHGVLGYTSSIANDGTTPKDLRYNPTSSSFPDSEPLDLDEWLDDDDAATLPPNSPQ